MVHDAGFSRNGTFLNGERVEGHPHYQIREAL